MKRTREQGFVCLEKEMDVVLTSAIPYSWRLGELTPMFKEHESYWSEATLNFEE